MPERTISGFAGDSVMNSEGCEDSLRQYGATLHRSNFSNFAMITVSKEDYLKAVAEAEAEGSAYVWVAIAVCA